MQGHNAEFVGNWNSYLNNVLVDNVTWFRDIGANNAAINALSLAKAGSFDLVPTSIAPRRVMLRIAPPGGIVADAGIGGYWCPFVQGGGLPGWVDLPRQAPAHNLMFTAAMQGCALVVTQSPVANHIRVYHHQHPDGANNGVWQALHAVGQPVLSILDYADYGPAGLNGNAPNAFNYMLFRNGMWNYVTQAHTLTNVMGPNGLVIQVNRRAGHGNNGVSITSVL
jgi:hypothetical protein